MLNRFLKHIQKEKLIVPQQKTVLAVSGGVDSVVMCDLFYNAGLAFGIAHCNFKLRNTESNKDEKFVEALATQYNVPFHSTSFKTNEYAKKNKLSIQMAARELRYKWFEEIRQQYQYSALATAHHQDDSVETFFINLVRGTGIAGLHGIAAKQGTIIRPLLFTTKQDILDYSTANALHYREDSSNNSDKYLRNKIRHHLIPLLKEINPHFEKAANDTIQHLSAVESVYKNEIENKRKQLVKSSENGYIISISALQKLHPANIYLYELLKPFEFNATTVEEIISALNGESGKKFLSPSYRLVKDRKTLLLQQLTSKKDVKNTFHIEKTQNAITINSLQLKFEVVPMSSTIAVDKSNISSSTALLDFDKLSFPMEIRHWKQGDVFYPLGMKGKKKLSDFFIDKKLSVYEKENCRLLTSNGKIVWVIGYRLDDRFKVTEKTKTLYRAQLLKGNTKY